MLMFPKAQPKRRKKRNLRYGMSEAHLSRVRSLPCCVCGDPRRSEAHHLKDTGAMERGLGLRSTDMWACPLCTWCHGEVERIGSKNELAWFTARGIDARALAGALWTNTTDVEWMQEVFAFHTIEARKLRGHRRTA